MRGYFFMPIIILSSVQPASLINIVVTLIYLMRTQRRRMLKEPRRTKKRCPRQRNYKRQRRLDAMMG